MTSSGSKQKVCRLCRRFVDGDVCPACNAANFSRSWKGLVIVNDPRGSVIAEKLGITAPGKYCMWVR